MGYAGAGETISVYNDPQIKIVDTAGGGIITLPMGYTLERFFNLTTEINTPAELRLTGTTRARKIAVKFSATAGTVITLWAGTVMDDVEFDAATREYTVSDDGDYSLTSWYDGSAWNTSIQGPDNT